LQTIVRGASEVGPAQAARCCSASEAQRTSSADGQTPARSSANSGPTLFLWWSISATRGS